jgi:hypothetical protein
MVFGVIATLSCGIFALLKGALVWRCRRDAELVVACVPACAEAILTPEVPVALRMSGHLLLGLAKIYQLQVNYLYVDCNSVISKIKQVGPRALQGGCRCRAAGAG